MTDLKLGKKPARPEAVSLKLATYQTGTLPTPPANFGWDNLIAPDGWGMLGNDEWGDCAIAGSLHETLLWRASAKLTTPLSTACAVKNYAAVTGFDPNAGPSGENPTDQGTDVGVLASYRRKTGLVDAQGDRHMVAAYVALKPGDLDQLAAATWIFGAVGFGMEVPAYCQEQFGEGKPWDIRRTNAGIEGGHYVVCVGRENGLWKFVTWGKVQYATDRFVQKYNDESVAYLSTEMLTNGVNLGGFNLAALQDDLQQVTAA